MNRLKSFALCNLILLTLLTILSGHIAADDQKPTAANADQPATVQLIVHPAAPPYATLKYRLIPKGIELTPGNAAPHYFRAAMVIGERPEYQSAIAAPDVGKNSKLENWLELPLDQLRKNEEAQKFYNDCPSGNWDLIYLAARREQCEWDLPVREFNIATLMPELRKLRDLARLLAFKARIEISRGQFDDAIETLKTGLAMARHAAKAPTLVNALVGANITGLMLNQVRVMIQQPDCPNLYWALTALPQPIVDLTSGLEFEGSFVYLFLPELRDVRTAVHTDVEWDKILLQVADKLLKVLPSVGDQKKDLGWYGMGALFAVTAYPKAKAQLQEAGYSPSQIKEMSVSQAILTAEVETFDHLNNDIFKWFYTDSVTALKGLADAERQLEEFGKSEQEIIPLASIMLSALKKSKSIEVETDRNVDALRIVEAIRLYAAKHNGQLPQQLSDIQEVPIPADPVTGQPFAYQLSGNRALLTSPAPPDGTAAEGLRWEIRLATAKK